MLKYTRAAISRIIKDLKLLSHVVTIVMQSFMIIYLASSIILEKGSIVINSVLCGLTVANFIFYLVTYGRSSRRMKKVKGRVSRAYSIAKLSINAISLASVIYSIYVGASDISGFTLVITPLMIILWILQVAFQLARAYVENRAALFIDGVQMDFEVIIKPYVKVKNVVHDFFGEEREDEDTVSGKNRETLTEQAKVDGALKSERRSARLGQIFGAVRSRFAPTDRDDETDEEKDPVTKS